MQEPYGHGHSSPEKGPVYFPSKTQASEERLSCLLAKIVMGKYEQCVMATPEAKKPCWKIWELLKAGTEVQQWFWKSSGKHRGASPGALSHLGLGGGTWFLRLSVLIVTETQV